jgi:hypothetical protein
MTQADHDARMMADGMSIYYVYYIYVYVLYMYIYVYVNA